MLQRTEYLQQIGHEAALAERIRRLGSGIEVAEFGSGDTSLTLVAHPLDFGESLTNAQIGERMADELAREADWDKNEPIKDSGWARYIVEEALKKLRVSSPEAQLLLRDLPKKIESGLTIEELAQSVAPDSKRTGIEVRHWRPEVTEGTSREEIVSFAVDTGVALLAAILKERAQTDVNLIVTSSFLPLSVAQQIEKRATALGILPAYEKNVPINQRRQVKEVRLFCAGSGLAFASTMIDPSFQNEKETAILSLEPLADNLARKGRKVMFSPEMVKLLSLFGNGFTGIGFDPSKVQLVEGSGAMYADDQGIMAVQAWYESLSQAGLPEDLVRIFDQESVVEAPFSHVDAGRYSAVVLKKDFQQDGRNIPATIDAKRLRDHMGGHTPQSVFEALQRIGIGLDHLFVTNHETSGPLSRDITTALRKLLNDQNWEGLRYTLAPFPPFNDGQPMSMTANASSATWLRQLHTLAKAGIYPKLLAEADDAQAVDRNALLVILMAIGAIIATLAFESNSNAAEQDDRTPSTG